MGVHGDRRRQGVRLSASVNGDAKNRSGSICGQRRACSSIYEREMLAIYIHLRQTLIGRSAAGRKGQQQQLLQ